MLFLRCHGITKILCIFLLYYPHNALLFTLTSCVDPDTPSSISLWKSTLPHKITQMNASSTITYEGTSNTGVEFDLRYGDKLRSTSGSPIVTRVYLFVEYINNSPRRILLQPIKSEKTVDFSLLEGVSTDGLVWRDAVEEIDVPKGEPRITGILKKPQSISFRKLIIFSLRSNSGESVASVVTQLRSSKSCSQVQRLTPSLQSPSPQPATQPRSPSQPTQKPKTTTTSCGTSTSTATGGDTCTVCPECKCVCNCNCDGC